LVRHFNSLAQVYPAVMCLEGAGRLQQNHRFIDDRLTSANDSFRFFEEQSRNTFVAHKEKGLRCRSQCSNAFQLCRFTA